MKEYRVLVGNNKYFYPQVREKYFGLIWSKWLYIETLDYEVYHTTLIRPIHLRDAEQAKWIIEEYKKFISRPFYTTIKID